MLQDVAWHHDIHGAPERGLLTSPILNAKCGPAHLDYSPCSPVLKMSKFRDIAVALAPFFGGIPVALAVAYAGHRIADSISPAGTESSQATQPWLRKEKKGENMTAQRLEHKSEGAPSG